MMHSVEEGTDMPGRPEGGAPTHGRTQAVNAKAGLGLCHEAAWNHGEGPPCLSVSPGLQLSSAIYQFEMQIPILPWSWYLFLTMLKDKKLLKGGQVSDE